MKYLLDTCLLSEMVRPNPEPAVLAWMRERRSHDLFVSAMTVGELCRGVARLPQSRRKNELQSWLRELEDGFADRILPFDHEAAHVWAKMCAHSESSGKPMAAFDSIIAATALAHGLCLVTRNVRDFSQAPIEVFNPWPVD